MDNEDFGYYIRILRRQAKMPLRKVAEILNVDPSTLSKAERGDRPISVGQLVQLSKILKVDLKELQVRYIADRILKNFSDLEFLLEGLEEAKIQLSKEKN